MTERKLIQSIIDRRGNCFHVNCSGGAYIPKKIVRENLEPLEGFSNLGVPCPLYDQCLNDSDQKDILLMAKIYMKKLKKEKKKDD